MAGWATPSVSITSVNNLCTKSALSTWVRGGWATFGSPGGGDSSVGSRVRLGYKIKFI
jgi:hypothetical protein